MSANEPTTGWEAQDWDPATHPVAAARERTDRLARLTPPDHGPDDGPDDGPDEHEADEAFADPVVPDEVETTVPIGATGTAEVVEEPVDPEPLVEPEAFVEPVEAPAPDSADEWRELQVQFVDDPAGAVEGAAALLRQAVETRTGATGSTDTEQLRRAFTRMRDLHARLTGDAPA